MATSTRSPRSHTDTLQQQRNYAHLLPAFLAAHAVHDPFHAPLRRAPWQAEELAIFPPDAFLGPESSPFLQAPQALISPLVDGNGARFFGIWNAVPADGPRLYGESLTRDGLAARIDSLGGVLPPPLMPMGIIRQQAFAHHLRPRIIAMRLRKSRMAKPITQQALGLLLGYPAATSQRMVANWELGIRPIPQAHIRPLAECLGLSPADLLP